MRTTILEMKLNANYFFAMRLLDGLFVLQTPDCSLAHRTQAEAVQVRAPRGASEYFENLRAKIGINSIRVVSMLETEAHRAECEIDDGGSWR
jgi:hypothetical protein